MGKTTSSKPNMQAISIKLKHNEDGEVILKRKARSILFASVTESKGNSHNIQAGMAGEFSMSSIAQSLESIITATAMALKEHHDFTPVQFLKLMGKVTTEAVENTFLDDDKRELLVEAIMDLVKNNNEK